MFESAPALQDPAPSATEETPDPAVLRAERRLRLLEELAEIGMELARRLPVVAAAEASATEDPGVAPARAKGRDPADVYGPLSRAIRLTLALEARTDAELGDLKAGVVQARAKSAQDARVAAAKAREDRIRCVRDLVLRVAEIEIEDPDTTDCLEEALEERFEDYEAEFASPERPLRETVDRLCKYLGLNPDWSRWTGEGWAPDETPVGPHFAKFRQNGAHANGAAKAGLPPPQPPTQPWHNGGAHDLE